MTMCRMCTVTPITRKVSVKNKTGSFHSLPGTVQTGADSSGFFVSGSSSSVRRVLGIDPGLASTGYGIIDCDSNRYRLVAYGVISTKNRDDRGVRLMEIYTRLESLIELYTPGESSMETLYFAKNVTSAMSVAEARGVVTLCLARHQIPLGEYTPNTIKQSVTGTATAGKTAVQEYVRLLLGMPCLPQPDHAADALAAAITHLHTVRK